MSLQAMRAQAIQAMGQPAFRILEGMVWLESGRVPMPWHRTLVAYASGHLPRAGSFRTSVAMLRNREMISYARGGIGDPNGPVGLVLEHLGRNLVDSPSGAFTRQAYWEKLDGKLGTVELLLCQALREMRGGPVPRDDLALVIGRKTTTREFRNAMANLLGVDLVSVEGGLYSATLNLCPLSVFELRELRT